jgi:signal transduction histidine kinase
MRRLHLKLYLAIVGTLLVFLISGALVWHHYASPRGAVSGIESATDLATSILNDPARSAEQQRAVIDALARQLRADVTLYDAGGLTPIHASGRVVELGAVKLVEDGWLLTRGGPTLNQPLGDGRHLLVHPHHRFALMGVHLGLMLTGIAVVLALLTYPIARGITARLARLQAGVLQFGAGNLAARVEVEGRDEVAALARSFNESAGRIEQLVRAHQMLLANCSHELRTPLARIRLAVERVTTADSQASSELTRSIKELDTLIGEMLLSSRLDASSDIERTEPVDLLALVAEEAAYFDREAHGDPATIDADPMLLRRLVRNLLDNAQVHAGGATDIRIEADETDARIVVEDAGAAIPGPERDRIFEPFYRAGAAKGSSGAGLGLAIVRQVARAHRGSVEYAARAGGGSRFTVTLPRRTHA